MSPGSAAPPDGGIGLWSALAGLGTTVLAILAGVLGLGKNIERTEETAKAAKLLAMENEKEIQKLKDHHVSDMQSIRDFFSTTAGGQKFVTFLDHDLICDRNNKATIAAIETLTSALRENSEIVERMGDKIHILNVDVAVLKERRESGQRQARGEG